MLRAQTTEMDDADLLLRLLRTARTALTLQLQLSLIWRPLSPPAHVNNMESDVHVQDTELGHDP